MKDIASHLMDIAQNSITADASLIEICLEVYESRDIMSLSIKDNGKGMSSEMLENVTSPFTTTRTTRKVGLGIPLFKEGAEKTGGSFEIESELGVGTFVKADYGLTHLDRAPLGDFAGVCSTLIVCNEDLDFEININSENGEYNLSTKEMREMLDGVPLSNPDVSSFIINNLKDGIDEVLGGNFE